MELTNIVVNGKASKSVRKYELPVMCLTTVATPMIKMYTLRLPHSQRTPGRTVLVAQATKVGSIRIYSPNLYSSSSPLIAMLVLALQFICGMFQTRQC